MKRYFSLFFVYVLVLNVYPAGFSISGNGFLYESFAPPAPAKGDVFIVKENGGNVSITFSVADSTGFEWYGYKKHPHKDTVPLGKNYYKNHPNGKSSTLTTLPADSGYCVKYTVKKGEKGEDGKDKVDTLYSCCRVVVYKPVNAVSWKKDEVFCHSLQLKIQPAMKYILPSSYGKDSVEGFIKRDLTITYSTFKADNNKKPYIDETVEKYSLPDTLLYMESVPYDDTDFSIKDGLATKLGLNKEFVSAIFKTEAVTAFPTMTVKNKGKNELDPDDSWDTDEFDNVVFHFSPELNEDLAAKFRTSAPLSVDLAGNASPKVNNYIWYIARNKDFSDAFFGYEKELNSYIFKEPGFYYLKLIVRNKKNLSDELCRDSSFACINISDSEILVPNVFTPNGDGLNDEFRVAYKSIESYRCRIYNQWGRKVYDSTDITKGWDGTIGSKQASVGAYFYIIEAKGTDGREFKKQGDINLIRSK